MLGLPLGVPILKILYGLDGKTCCINAYPTLQFLYSHNIIPDYITSEVKQIVSSYNERSSPDQFVRQFHGYVDAIATADEQQSRGVEFDQLDFNVRVNYI